MPSAKGRLPRGALGRSARGFGVGGRDPQDLPDHGLGSGETRVPADLDRLFGGEAVEVVGLQGEEPADAIAATAVNDQGTKVDKKDIVLDEPIKTLGEFPVKIKVHPGMSATITVVVTGEE